MLSKEGRKFIEDLRAYFISYGIKEAEMEEFLEEAKDHLLEGEKNGKTVEDIFGKSPKSYAKEVASVLSVSKKENIMLIIHLIIGIFGTVLVANLIQSPLNISWIELIGYPVSFILWIVFTVIAFRMTSFMSEMRRFLYTWLYMMIPSTATIGVLFLNRLHDHAILTVDGMARWILGIILIITILINLSALINFKFSITYVMLVFGSLFLFEYFKLEQFVYSELRFIPPIVFAFALWHFYGRKIVNNERTNS